MIRAHCCAGWLLLLAAFGASAQDADFAGMVKTSRGTVLIDRAGKRLPAPVGTQVQAGDKLRTGDDGAVGVTLRDATLLSAGPNSILVIDKFAFDPTSHKGGMTATVRKGTLAVVTGKLAKEAPESVEFRTPTAVLGVRGTEFAVEVLNAEDE